MKNSQTLNRTLHQRCILVTIFLMVISGWSALSSGDVYTWKDKNGKVHMTQTAPPEGATLLRHKAIPTPTPIKANQGENPKIRGTATTDDERKSPTPQDTVTVRPTVEVEKDDQGHTKSWWQQRKQRLEAKKKRAEHNLEQIKDTLRILYQGQYRYEDRQRYEAARKKAEKELEEVQRELDSLADELRRAGGPPGWLR